MKKTEPFVTLQYVRALAALAVVYYHAAISSIYVIGTEYSIFPLLGAGGVDLFFVLSGFVIWTSTSERDISPAAFMWHRAARIIPLYWSCTFLISIIVLVAPSLARATIVEPIHLIASLIFLPWPNPAAATRVGVDLISPVLVPGWTLNFEMLFYLCFAIALLVSRERRLLTLIGVIGVVAICAWFVREQSAVARFFHPARLLEFVAGVGIAWQLERYPLKVGKPLLSVFIVTGIAMIVVAEASHVPDRYWIIACGATLIIFGLVVLERDFGAASWGWLKRLGDASYSIYLTHVFVIAALRQLLVQWQSYTPWVAQSLSQSLYVVVCLSTTAYVGLIVHHCYDERIGALLKSKKSERSQAAADSPA